MIDAAGDIYKGEYEAWYCVGCESFKTPKELVEENLCPMHKRPVERVKEESYFFRLSNYTDRLLQFYEEHPTFVQPESRFNEVKSFVREGLRDLSVSRTTFKWGVPVPGDSDHVMYVWLDALTNYISALGGPAAAGEEDLFDRYWAPNADVVHIVGKDILRFHAVYWPAFLLSAGVEPPSQIWAHGWLTIDGEKMSKGLGNFIPPGPLVDAFGADVVRYYLMRDVAFGQDGDFNHANVVARYHGDLGNGLGNLLNRMIASIVKKNLGGKVPTPGELLDVDQALLDAAGRCAKAAAEHMDGVAPHRALESIWELVAAANKYVDQTEPWKLAKEADPTRLQTVGYTVLEAIRWLGVMLWPVMPDKCDALLAQLGLAAIAPTGELDQWPRTWGGLPEGTTTAPGAPLFPRFDESEEKAVLERLRAHAPTGANSTPEGKPMIEYDDFSKLDLRVGVVRTAEAVAKSKKLLRLTVDVGEAEPRQVLAGISEHYEADQLVGKRVVVVANLKPRKMMGLESQGMVLAASNDEGLTVVEVPEGLPPGAQVS